LLATPESRAKKRDAREIEHQNAEVDWADLHRADLVSVSGYESRDANCPV